MIRKTKGDFILNFLVELGGVRVSHLQFVNDSMIFCDTDVRQLNFLRCLCCFEAVSGSNINLAKSELLQVGYSGYRSVGVDIRLKIGSLPLTYMSLPLGASYKSKLVWETIIKRIGFRLKAWKAYVLSKGGRLNLLKSTLASIPNYFLSLFTIPTSVANRIEAKFRNFLWNDLDSHHWYHLVDSKTICKSLCYWGLRVRSIRGHTKVLLAK